MTSISSLLNLGNTDYQGTLGKKSREEEENLAVAREKLAQERLEKQSTAQQFQEVVDNQHAMRRLHQLEQEIQQLTLTQAQLMLDLTTDKIVNSSAMQLQQMQVVGNSGIIAPAYI